MLLLSHWNEVGENLYVLFIRIVFCRESKVNPKSRILYCEFIYDMFHLYKTINNNFSVIFYQKFVYLRSLLVEKAGHLVRITIN